MTKAEKFDAWLTKYSGLMLGIIALVIVVLTFFAGRQSVLEVPYKDMIVKVTKNKPIIYADKVYMCSVAWESKQ